MNRLIIIVGTVFLLLIASCGKSKTNDIAKAETPAELQLPAIPTSLTTPQERAAFLIEHFWDYMNFCDTLQSHDRDFIEQNFVNFIDLFRLSDSCTIETAVEKLLVKAEVDHDAYMLLADIAEHYLYEPNSPMRCEEYYIMFLRRFVTNLVPDESEKERWAVQLSDALKNRPGTEAADFAFTDRYGHQQTLHKVIDGLTLLIFYDPDCEHCAEIIEELKASYTLNLLVKEKRLRIVAIYADNNAEVWNRTKNNYPTHWTIGINTDHLQERGAYILRAMPTLYLINADKTVWLKDPTVHIVIESLNRQ